MFNNKALRFIVAIIVGLLPLESIASTPHILTNEAPIIKEDFNSMWDSETSTPSLTLPKGWVVDRNLTAPRKVGAWESASSSVMYSGGVSLASNAKNGTWNFGASDNPIDRAVGGLTTTVASGTRGVSIMTAITNGGTLPLRALELSYNIEKYRKGANAAGFAVQVYTSADGVNWTDAGSAFKTVFTPDSETLGAEIVPITTTAVENRTMLVDILPGNTLYLAWNISVASGSTPDKAPGLAIDDITIKGVYSSAVSNKLFIENAVGKSPLSVYSTSTDFYGVAPGKTADGVKIVNGVEYSVWPMPSTENFALSVVSGDTTYEYPSLNCNEDAYMCLSALGLSKIENPDSYAGWVDPSRPTFTPSGIYLRGEVNAWGVSSDWEFSKEGNGQYVLYNKKLNGSFKIADASWSGSCNYGSNGANILPDTPYELKSGTDGNISCGALMLDSKRITLTISAEGKAYLLIESNDESSDLTSVYMVGDFNSWNYMDSTGELKLDSSDNLFKGRVTMCGGSNNLSYWRIYQRLGMGGSWGLSNNATQSTSIGNLAKGETCNAAITPGTYDVTFSLTDGAYTFTEVASTASVIKLTPSTTILTPTNPETVKVLSLNNSLIHYNDQDVVFNNIAKAMCKDANWTKHTNLGKPLSYHWDEGDGLRADGAPSAKMLIRSEAWSHIILQEQSSLPRTQPETFRKSVEQWVNYIREYCPNPNAVIILPVNWGYSSDWTNFMDYNRRFVDVYTSIASEYGCVVCPIANAYSDVYAAEGMEGTSKWFSDDRHPTPISTYMAACMEYGTVFGEDPNTITYTPSGIDSAVAVSLRNYASKAVKGYVNQVNHLAGTVQYSCKVYDDFGVEKYVGQPQFSVNGGGSISESGLFSSDGTRGEFTINAICGEFKASAKVSVADHKTIVVEYPSISINEDKLTVSENFDGMGEDATANLPEGWRIDRQIVAPRTLGTYGAADVSTMYSGGVNLASNAKNGTWNFGADNGEDRAVGGITTGIANGSRAINIYTHLKNTGRKNIENIQLSYDVEKYRKGNNSAGFAVQLYYSYDGRNWVSADKAFYTYLAPDAETAGYSSVPGETIPVSGTLLVPLGAGMDLYLGWNISVATGDIAQSAMAIGIDNVLLEGSLPAIPVTDHKIYVDNQTSWSALGLYAWGDSELFGVWPGQAPIDEIESEGVKYKVFGLNSAGGNYHLIFNNWNNNKQLPDYDIVANRDYWFCITDNAVKELSAPSADEIVIAPEVESEVIYYTLSGSRVINPSKGLYIKVVNGKATKVMVR